MNSVNELCAAVHLRSIDIDRFGKLDGSPWSGGSAGGDNRAYRWCVWRAVGHTAGGDDPGCTGQYGNQLDGHCDGGAPVRGGRDAWWDDDGQRGSGGCHVQRGHTGWNGRDQLCIALHFWVIDTSRFRQSVGDAGAGDAIGVDDGSGPRSIRGGTDDTAGGGDS